MFERRLSTKTMKSLQSVSIFRHRIESELSKLSVPEQAIRICELGSKELKDQRHKPLWAMLYRQFVLTAWSITDERPRNRFVQIDMAQAVCTPFPKSMSHELYAIGSAAICIIRPKLSREGFFTEKEVDNLISKCAAFTLGSLLYVCGKSKQPIVFAELKKRINEIEVEDRFLILKEISFERNDGNFDFITDDDIAELKRRASEDLDADKIRTLSGLALISFFGFYREDAQRRPHFFILADAIEAALNLADQDNYDFFGQFICYVDVIVRKKTLLDRFNIALLTHLREYKRAVTTLLELSESRIFPGSYVAKILLDLKASLPEMQLVFQVYLLVALSNVGVFERELSEMVIENFLANEQEPVDTVGIEYLCHFVASVALIDFKLKTQYLPRLWNKIKVVFEQNLDHEELDLILLYRATTAVGVELEGELRKKALEKAQVIKRNRPRNSEPENRFFTLLQKALSTDLNVEQSGFCHSYHFDFRVVLTDGSEIDHELDDAVHEIRNANGEDLWLRGEDILRDLVLERCGVRTIRTPIEILDEEIETAVSRIKSMYV